MSTPLPDWLSFTPESSSDSGVNVRTLEKRERNLKIRDDHVGAVAILHPNQFPTLFEVVLGKICDGQSLNSALADDVRSFNRAEFLKWINRNPERKRRYHEAQEVGAELIAGEMIGIADAEDSLEDVARSALRINTRKYLLSVWNRKRYSETKQIDMTTSISVSKALEQADQRLLLTREDDSVIDVDSKEVD